eukprot:239574-Rhodomonas_salina.1
MRPSMTSLCSRAGGDVRVGIVASAAVRRAESERFGVRAGGGGVGARVLRVLVLCNMLPKGCAVGAGEDGVEKSIG